MSRLRKPVDVTREDGKTSSDIPAFLRKVQPMLIEGQATAPIVAPPFRRGVNRRGRERRSDRERILTWRWRFTVSRKERSTDRERGGAGAAAADLLQPHVPPD